MERMGRPHPVDMTITSTCHGNMTVGHDTLTVGIQKEG